MKKLLAIIFTIASLSINGQTLLHEIDSVVRKQAASQARLSNVLDHLVDSLRTKSITVTSPITKTGSAIGINDAVANGTGKGAATFTASDFNSSGGVISIDYTNAQKATSSQPGLLTSTDWTTFNNKQNAGVGSDTQIIQNISGSLSGSSSLTYNPSTNNFNVGNLTQVGSGIRVNNFWMGKDHIDSVGTGSSSGWFFGQGEGHHINVQSSGILNDSYLYKGFNNSIIVSGSQVYNSGIDGGQGNYIKAISGAFVGTAGIYSSIGSRVNVSGLIRKGLGIIGGEKNVISGHHSWAIGGYGLTDNGDSAKVVVPNLKIQYTPVNNDTISHILVRDNSTGLTKTRRASSLSGSGWATSGSTTVTTPTIIGTPLFRNEIDLDSSANINRVRLKTMQSHAYGDFWLTLHDNNFGDTQHDQIMNLGYNTNGAGGRQNTNDGAMWISMESHFNGISSDDFEFHCPEVTTRNGATNVRIFSVNAKKSDLSAIPAFYHLSRLEVRNPLDDNPYLTLVNGSTTVTSTTGGTASLTLVGSGGNSVIQTTNTGLQFLNNQPTHWNYEFDVNDNGTNSGLFILKNVNATPGATGYSINSNNALFYYVPSTSTTVVKNNSSGMLQLQGTPVQSVGNFNTTGNTAVGSASNNATLYVSQTGTSSAWLPAYRIDPGAHTSLTASTEFNSVDERGATQTWAAGTLATQRFRYHKAYTLAFASASTATTVYGDYFEAPIQGTNATITNNFAVGIAGNLSISTVGNGIFIKEGSDARMGSATLTTGSVTVSNNKVTANSRIFVVSQVDGGTPGFLRVSSRTAGTSFTITSSSALDTSTVAWIIVEPAP